MFRSLPPLNPLKAFECAARHGSLTRAAAELGVSQVAISRQVRALEQFLEVSLIRRGHRSIELTTDGLSLAASATSALDIIAAATATLSRRNAPGVLTIDSYRTFSQRWLIPRLSQFHQMHPEIEVRLMASGDLQHVEWGSVDAAIRSGFGKWRDVDADLLIGITLALVCTPKYLEEHGPIAQPDDLKKQTLLSSLTRPDDWRRWAIAAGLGPRSLKPELKFQNSALALEAAQESVGIAIIAEELVSRQLADGVFVKLTNMRCATDEGYYLLSSLDRKNSRALSLFRQWLETAH